MTMSAWVTYAVFAAATVAVLGIWLGLMAVVDHAHRVMETRQWGERGGIFVDILIIAGVLVAAGVIFGACL